MGRGNDLWHYCFAACAKAKNQGERAEDEVLNALNRGLPAHWVVVGLIPPRRTAAQGRRYSCKEIDAVIAGDRLIFVAEIKSHQGTIRVSRGRPFQLNGEDIKDPANKDAGFWGNFDKQCYQIKKILDVKVGIKDRNTSTALIGRNGQVYDFNVTRVDGTRTNTEVFFGGRHGTRDAAAINPIQLAFPHYARANPRPGDMVGFVQHESAWPWAQYVYRGTTVFRGTDAIVLDLLSLVERDGRNEMLTIGFSIVGRRNWMPLYYAVDAGFTIEAEQVSCR